MLSKLMRFLGREQGRVTSGETQKLREPEVRREPKVRFLREQDGEPERILKGTLSSLLALRSGVSRAYLARADYGQPTEYEVVLCIVGPEDRDLVREVASIFARQFGRDAHLDILFLD